MPPKVVAALEPDPEKITFLEKMLGAFCLFTFVGIWILSIASPRLLVYALVYGYNVLAISIVLLTVAAYLPWKKQGLLFQVTEACRRFYAHFTPCYFKSIVMQFEGDELPKPDDPQTFYAIHPHGAFCIGWGMLFCHSVLQHVRFCFAPALYISPFFRLFARCTGNPGSAAKYAMLSYMKKGESLALPPGGFEEATLTSTQKDRVFIQKRTGFIRLCLEHGIRVRPVYVFGEKGFYWNIQGMFEMRLALNRYGIPTLLAWGHPISPLLPKSSVDMRIVVGAPIVLPKIEQPSKEDVKKWHDKYVAALIKLFEDHKEAAYGPETGKAAKLEVW